MKETIRSEEAPAPIGPYSQAVAANGFVFLSGQIALDAETGVLIKSNVADETRKVMQNIGAVLKARGLDYSAIVKTSIFLKSMRDFGTVNEVYGEYFDSDPPARETVEVSCLPKDVNVEISVIAVERG